MSIFAPNPKRTERGFLEVKENWRRLACDVTHYQNRRYLTMIDCGPSRFSIWKVIASESAQELSNVVEGIFREMGPPCEMLLDNYSSFRSKVFTDMLNKWSVHRLFRCANRPEGDGIIERHHRTVKRMAARSGNNILDMVHGYNISPRNLGFSPSERIFKHRWKWLHDKEGSREPAKECHLKIGDVVFVKPVDRRCTSRWQEGKVTKIISPWNVEINGMPRHIKDVRISGVADCVEVNYPQSIQSIARAQPKREVRPPVCFADYVMY